MNKQIDLKALLEKKLANIEPLENSKLNIEQAQMNIPKNLMFHAEATEFIPETTNSSLITRSLTVEEAKQFDDEMNRFINNVLVPGTDFGKIPKFKELDKK